MKIPPIPAGAESVMGDYRRFPGCRLQLVCAMCGWSKTYSPERVIARLQDLRAGGHRTPLGRVAARVAWTCPACGRVRWRVQFAWPPKLDDREAKRLANLYRN